MACRRDGFDHQRQAPLLVGRGGSGRQHPRYPGAEAAQQARGEKVLQKATQGVTYVPRVLITDKLKRYGAAKRQLLPGVEHRQSRYLNNRCENSHRPTRQRESRMQGFKSPGYAQRFLAAYGPIAQHFRPRWHLLSASEYRQEMAKRLRVGRITSTERAASRGGRTGDRHPLA